MSRAADATETEIRAAFEDALAGGPARTDTGLDPRVWEAIALVRMAREGRVLPDVGPLGPLTGPGDINTPMLLEEAARALLEAQLNGTLASLDEAEQTASATEAARRHGILQ